ncbi:hypothetical protein [Halocella sp. SP3-1]|uniref:hypothetical protein n=1 Tax=Halocella sp. SP3-1 TaxID=2382161 RepID=UPI000F7596DD|nr:hypothetical protein [Halocella sp. SP3-1]AZO96458.1 hypothetical protein D7D81_18705 [Halocella sp. SP3-1]
MIDLKKICKRSKEGRIGKKIVFTRIRVKTLLIVPLSIIGYFTYQGSRAAIEEKVGFYSKEIVKY